MSGSVAQATARSICRISRGRRKLFSMRGAGGCQGKARSAEFLVREALVWEGSGRTMDGRKRRKIWERLHEEQSGNTLGCEELLDISHLRSLLQFTAVITQISQDGNIEGTMDRSLRFIL